MRKTALQASSRALPGRGRRGGAVTRAVAPAEPLADGGDPDSGELEVCFGGLKPGEGQASERVEGSPTLGSGIGCVIPSPVMPGDAFISDVPGSGMREHFVDDNVTEAVVESPNCGPRRRRRASEGISAIGAPIRRPQMRPA